MKKLVSVLMVIAMLAMLCAGCGASQAPATEAPAEELISASKAKSIARKHAGVSSSKVKGMECEYDVDDGVLARICALFQVNGHKMVMVPLPTCV